MTIRLLAGLIAVPLVVAVYALSVVNRSEHRAHSAATSFHQEVAKPAGAISGRVLDPEGHPVREAQVQALNTEVGMGKVPTAYTNRDGVFLIENLTPGIYRLTVAKEGDGYPPTDSTFYYPNSVEVQQVVVYDGKTVDAAALHLGQKVAELKGRIVDSTTRKGIVGEGVLVTLHRTDDLNAQQTTTTDENGNFEVLVPPVPTIIEVSAPGYKKKKLKPLLLMRGEIGPFRYTVESSGEAVKFTAGCTERSGPVTFGASKPQVAPMKLCLVDARGWRRHFPPESISAFSGLAPKTPWP